MSAAAIEDDKPTVAERYANATESTDLQLRPRSRGAADMLIAAGLMPEFLGIVLLRLVSEFERSRAHVRCGNQPLNHAEQVLVLGRLRTLRLAKQSLGRYAEWRATKEAFMASPEEVAKITGRALVAFLNPKCPACEGRGFNGGGRHEQTGTQMLCRACRGSGQQRQAIGRSNDEIAFVGLLLKHMDEAMDNASRGIASNRTVVEEAKQAIDEELRKV